MGDSQRKTAAIRQLLDEADCPSEPCSAILERIRVNDQFLDIVNGLYCDAPALFEGLRRKALPLHAEVNQILRKMLRYSQQNSVLSNSPATTPPDEL
tara:strand:- start:97 stop:387 length:291 start_codon:yes stop_codon:yes gene_type:complete